MGQDDTLTFGDYSNTHRIGLPGCVVRLGICVCEELFIIFTFNGSRKMKKLIALLVAVLFVSLAQATPVEQAVNGSFESGSVPPASTWGYWGSAGDDWTFGKSGAGDVLRATGGGGSPWWGRVADEGQVFIALSVPASESAWVSQQLEGLVIGETYSIDFAATLGPGESGASDLEIYIGNTLVYDVSMARYGWYHSADFGVQTYVANATDGSNPVLKLVHVNDTAASHKMCLDSVSVMGAEVPEPATLVLLGLGGIVTAIRRRRS